MQTDQGQYDLHAGSSLSLTVLSDGRLMFGSGLAPMHVQARRSEELSSVLLDPIGCEPMEVYWMYRAVSLSADRDRFARAGVRYDITVLRPGTVGREYIKTAGHFHPVCPDTGLAYPEVYEVLFGTANFLLQLPGDGEDVVAEALLVEVQAGETLVIPPGYGHVAINASTDWLVTANLVADCFDNYYDPYIRAGGGAFFLVKSPSGYTCQPNSRLKLPVTLRRRDPWGLNQLGIEAADPIYALFQRSPEDFKFLLKPDCVNWAFSECSDGSQSAHYISAK